MEILTTLTVVVSLAIMNYSIASDYIPTGTRVTIYDPTNTVVFGTDTLENMDLLMQYIRYKDHAAIKELHHEGHLIAVKNGSKGRTIKYSNYCYLIRVHGSNHPAWFIETIVSRAE